MKTGRTIQELAYEVERQARTRRDFVANANTLTMIEQDGTAMLEVPKAGRLAINPYAHGQLATNVGIPKPYYDRMLASKPALIATHVNHWLRQDDSRNMVRTLDATTRAILSDRYRPLDNMELLLALVPLLQDNAIGFQVQSAEITETRFYLKLAVPSLTAAVKVGDEVMAGVVVQNSEVGAGSLEAAAFLTRLACTNGMKVDKYAKRKNHVGRQIGSGEGAEEFYQDDTRRASDVAFFLQIRDTVKALLEPAGFNRVVEDLRDATDRKIEAKPEDAVQEVANRWALNDGQRDGIFRHLVDGGLGMNQYSLVQAVTRAAEDQNDYDVASTMEKIGGEILTLDPSAWKSIATAETVPARRRKAAVN